MKTILILLIWGLLGNIVPIPEKIVESSGAYVISDGIYATDCSENETFDLISHFGKIVNLPVNKTGRPKNGIIFSKDSGLAKEAYRIEISSKKVTVSASEYRGFLHACVTLLQLLPDSAFTSHRDKAQKWELPCCIIEDSPKYEYRALMIDVARHFFSINEIKRIIRAMSLYKMNVLHLHLNDEQGWRLAIDRYPELTRIGAFRSGTCIGHHLETYDNVNHGGFFTKNDIREIISYAGKFGVDIVPEIDVPGHAIAALASYPELSCDTTSLEVRRRWVHTKESMCLGKDSTYEFIFNVFDEVADLFPFKFIHIGGDECETDHWKRCPLCQKKIADLGLHDEDGISKETRLQQHLTRLLTERLKKKGKTIIGWNEIYKAADIDPSAVITVWNDKNLGRQAANDGHKVIYAFQENLYINRVQSGDLINEPLGYISEGTVTLRDTYSADPSMGLEKEAAGNVIGVEACLWSEYVDQSWLLEYMMLPRLLAVAELGWCDAADRDYDRFTNALKERQFSILETLGYPYRGRFWYQKEISCPPEDLTDTTSLITAGPKVSSSPEENESADTVRILGFGNSWTRDSMRWLSAIARSAGRPVIVGHAYLGGSTLEQQFYGIDDPEYIYIHGTTPQKVHATYQYWKYNCTEDPVKTPSKDYENGKNGIGVTLESVLKDESWDIIIFQPSQSAFACDNFKKHMGRYDGEFNLNALVNKVKSLMRPQVAAKVKTGLMIPFSYPKGCTRHSPFMAEEICPGKNPESQEEWDDIFEKYHWNVQEKSQEFADFMGENCAFTINVGQAIYDARQDSLLSKTGYLLQRSIGNTHLSEGMAMYVASLCYAYVLLGLDKDEFTFYPHKTADSQLTGDRGQTDSQDVKNTPEMAGRAREIAYRVTR